MGSAAFAHPVGGAFVIHNLNPNRTLLAKLPSRAREELRERIVKSAGA